jgi:uncharacterized protein YwqG
MFKNIEELREKIKVFGLEKHEDKIDKIVALAKPAIRMLPKRVEDDEIPIGASKLGGNPDLSEDFEWKYYQGKPLTFIGQFKLSELEPYDRDKELPAEGILYFFYDADEMDDNLGAWFVFYTEDEQSFLVRREHPRHAGIINPIAAMPSQKLSFANSITLPRIYINETEKYGFQHDEFKAYSKLRWFGSEQPCHYFLGYPFTIDDPVEWDCVKHSQNIKPQNVEGYSYYTEEQLSYLEDESKKWKFILQIDSDGDLGIFWGDLGSLYVCVQKEDLLLRRFDKAWTIIQCH